MRKLISVLFFFILQNTFINAQGNVYLIIGSDTAIWQGMDVAKYNCYYDYNVIPDNTRHFYEVMQQSYRDKFSDSYGNKLKLTWWLMCGNIFRYATNKNVPYANMIVPYISKKYYRNYFEQYGDELSLHYHTFAWTDYDNDGKFYWNQAKNFNECLSDFNFTLAQMLIEENIFPVSFRSGWNYMSNEWQAELDKILPYSMHNEAPAYRVDNIEPTDNNFDWRFASQEFVPYRPSPQNYQLNGNGKGWNLHSKNVASINQTEMNKIFTKAKTQDQVVCLWGHVWDDNFPESVLKIDSLAKASAIIHPTVKFKYTSAVEGMQLWRKINDYVPPDVNIQEIFLGNDIKYIVTIDEQIFQVQPFAAVKSIDESYQIINFIKTGAGEWTSIKSFDKNKIAKVGLAVTDTLGNLTKKFINYLSNDIYIDNNDIGYNEQSGIWSTEQKAAWGLDSRKSILQPNDSSKVSWSFNIDKSNYYNIFIQVPAIIQPCKNIQFKIFSNNQLVEKINFSNSLIQMDWVYITTKYFEQSSSNVIEMAGYGTGQTSTTLSADVIKITPLVRNKWLSSASNVIDLGDVIVKDTTKYFLELANYGIENLTVTKIESKKKFLQTNTALPLIIPKFSKKTIPLNFYSAELGDTSDSLFIHSDDSFSQVYTIVFNAEVKNYFKLIDNEETSSYKEFGTWATSVAQAYGASSRYAFLNQSPKAYSTFTTKLRESGNYDIYFIVPKTVNASNNALYTLMQGSTQIDSFYVDQNANSGGWIKIKSTFLSKDSPVQIKIADDGKSTAGSVLRADAVKFTLISATSAEDNFTELPDNFMLSQNYPNPFNPTTNIKYTIPFVESRHASTLQHVTLKVYDVLGREVATLVDEYKQPGSYNCEWRIANGELPSGIYFYRLTANEFVETKKMVFLK